MADQTISAADRGQATQSPNIVVHIVHNGSDWRTGRVDRGRIADSLDVVIV